MDFLTAEEIGHLLGISVSSARTIIKRHIPHYRVARGEYRVAQKDFDRFLVDKKIRPHEVEK